MLVQILCVNERVQVVNEVRTCTFVCIHEENVNACSFLVAIMMLTHQHLSPLPSLPLTLSLRLLLFLPHSVGQPKHSRVMAGGLEGEFFFGSKAEVSTKLFDPNLLINSSQVT